MSVEKKKTSSDSKKGLTFTSALTLLFIALKLLHKIEWSWVWVLSPMWISFVLAVILVLVSAAISVKEAEEKRKLR